MFAQVWCFYLLVTYRILFRAIVPKLISFLIYLFERSLDVLLWYHMEFNIRFSYKSRRSLYAKTYLSFSHLELEFPLISKIFFSLYLLVFVCGTAFLNLDSTVLLLIHFNISLANHPTPHNAKLALLFADTKTLFE